MKYTEQAGWLKKKKKQYDDKHKQLMNTLNTR